MNNIEIHINNYEEFALDYLENNLSPSTKITFESFLKSHPEIAEEINGILDYRLIADSLVYEDKEKLKRNPSIFFTYRFGVFAMVLAFLLAGGMWTFLSSPDNLSSISNDSQEVNKVASSKSLSTEPMSSQSMDIKPTDQLDETLNTGSNMDASDARASSDLSSQTDHSKETVVENAVESENKKESESKADAHTSDINKAKNKVSEKMISSKNEVQRIDDETENKKLNTSPTENIFIPLTKSKKTKNGQTPIAYAEKLNVDTNHISIADVQSVDLKSTIQEQEQQSHDGAVNKIESIDIAIMEPTLNETNEDLANRIPDITIDIEPLSGHDDIIASAETPNKKRKISFRNFLPEQFAGISKEDIKRSLLPENLTTK
jgi:hypothetical protein